MSLFSQIDFPWDSFDDLLVWIILALITALFAHNLQQAYKRWRGLA